MKIKEYQKSAMSFTQSPDKPIDEKIIQASLGICGEAGELAEKVKKCYIENKQSYTKEEWVHEMGDILWYMTLMCDAMGVDIEEVMTANIEKLTNRYKDDV